MSFQNKSAFNKAEYEPGMDIFYDDKTNIAQVNFRGLSFETLDIIKDKQATIKVAEDYCRCKGWAG